MAGFEVIIYGRFWVITEDIADSDRSLSRQIAELLGLAPHTVAKGRRQPLAQDVEADRVRAAGGGRKPVKKNACGDRCDSRN